MNMIIIDLFDKAGYQVEHTTTVESFKKYKTYFKKEKMNYCVHLMIFKID